MATTITGKLNKPANIFQAGDSTGFGIRLGVKYRDPKTKQDEWCNYSAVIFAKSPGQVQFYTDCLVEGSVIEVSAEQLKVDSFTNDKGTSLSIDMLNARLGFVYTGQSAPQQQAQPQQQSQGGYQQPQQQSYQQAPQQQSGFNNQQQAPRDNQGFTQAQGGFSQQNNQQ